MNQSSSARLTMSRSALLFFYCISGIRSTGTLVLYLIVPNISTYQVPGTWYHAEGRNHDKSTFKNFKGVTTLYMYVR